MLVWAESHAAFFFRRERCLLERCTAEIARFLTHLARHLPRPAGDVRSGRSVTAALRMWWFLANGEMSGEFLGFDAYPSLRCVWEGLITSLHLKGLDFPAKWMRVLHSDG